LRDRSANAFPQLCGREKQSLETLKNAFEGIPQGRVVLSADEEPMNARYSSQVALFPLSRGVRELRNITRPAAEIFGRTRFPIILLCFCKLCLTTNPKAKSCFLLHFICYNAQVSEHHLLAQSLLHQLKAHTNESLLRVLLPKKIFIYVVRILAFSFGFVAFLFLRPYTARVSSPRRRLFWRQDCSK
jgi:hypothetical protein